MWLAVNSEVNSGWLSVFLSSIKSTQYCSPLSLKLSWRDFLIQYLKSFCQHFCSWCGHALCFQQWHCGKTLSASFDKWSNILALQRSWEVECQLILILPRAQKTKHHRYVSLFLLSDECMNIKLLFDDINVRLQTFTVRPRKIFREHVWNILKCIHCCGHCSDAQVAVLLNNQY